MADKYDTPLSPSEESAFGAWKRKNAPRDSGYDYDLRGAFKGGVRQDPKTGHWPDTWKKPNHPTFSLESQYAKDAPEKAGSWDGEQYRLGSRPTREAVVEYTPPPARPPLPKGLQYRRRGE